jgi:hypothetical protein
MEGRTMTFTEAYRMFIDEGFPPHEARFAAFVELGIIPGDAVTQEDRDRLDAYIAAHPEARAQGGGRARV